MLSEENIILSDQDIISLTNGESIRKALRVFDKTEELGRNPLAKLSIVRVRCQKSGYGDTPKGRGLALRDVLNEAIETIRPPGAPPLWAEGILEYFKIPIGTSQTDIMGLDDNWQEYLTLKFTVSRINIKAASDQLNIAERTFSYKRDHAANKVGDVLFMWEQQELPPLISVGDKYIERKVDDYLKKLVTRMGETVTIRAPRQTGKTLLLSRALYHAQQHGVKFASLDMQRFSGVDLDSYDAFLRQLAILIAHKLQIEISLEKAWDKRLGPNNRLHEIMEDQILKAASGPIILALDEADSLLLHNDFPYQDFFGLLRSWHNERSGNIHFQKLNLVLVISTEPDLLISDKNISPFNVGEKIYLKDFNETEVRILNQRFGSPVEESEFPQLYAWLGGHPYLTSEAFTLLRDHPEKWRSWANLENVATDNDGPFGTHLRNLLVPLNNQPSLQKALKLIIQEKPCQDKRALFRLSRAGLIKGSGDDYTYRCHLYKRYFEENYNAPGRSFFQSWWNIISKISFLP